MIIARRSFLIGLTSALVAPAVVKLEAAERALGGEVVSARVSPEMAWRIVREIVFTCVGRDGELPESRFVDLQVGGAGTEGPYLHVPINQRGGSLYWSIPDPSARLHFTPAAPMVIRCDPPPKGCDARLQMVFQAKDGSSYWEDLTWRDARLIASNIISLEREAA